jgi:hypothetical protein
VWSAGCGSEGIDVRRTADFELQPADGNWSVATVTASDSHSVTLKMQQSSDGMEMGGGKVVAVRYLWSQSPGWHDKTDRQFGNVSVCVYIPRSRSPQNISTICP